MREPIAITFGPDDPAKVSGFTTRLPKGAVHWARGTEAKVRGPLPACMAWSDRLFKKGRWRFGGYERTNEQVTVYSDPEPTDDLAGAITCLKCADKLAQEVKWEADRRHRMGLRSDDKIAARLERAKVLVASMQADPGAAALYAAYHGREGGEAYLFRRLVDALRWGHDVNAEVTYQSEGRFYA